MKNMKNWTNEALLIGFVMLISQIIIISGAIFLFDCIPILLFVWLLATALSVFVTGGILYETGISDEWLDSKPLKDLII